jgi:hypothetical protein
VTAGTWAQRRPGCGGGRRSRFHHSAATDTVRSYWSHLNLNATGGPDRCVSTKGSDGLKHLVLNNYNVFVDYTLKSTFRPSLNSDTHGGLQAPVASHCSEETNRHLHLRTGTSVQLQKTKERGQPHKNTCSNFAIIDSNRRYIYGFSEDKLHVTSAVGNCLTFLALLVTWQMSLTSNTHMSTPLLKTGHGRFLCGLPLPPFRCDAHLAARCPSVCAPNLRTAHRGMPRHNGNCCRVNRTITRRAGRDRNSFTVGTTNRV